MMRIRALLGAIWRNRMGPVLIALQVALALTVIVNVVYLVQQRVALSNRPTGMDIENIFWIVSEGYTADYDHALTVREDLDGLNNLPGVRAAAITQSLPQTFAATTLAFSWGPPDQERSESAMIYLTSDRFIEALGLQLASGRAYTKEVMAPTSPNLNEAFGNWPPEIVVTRAFAERLFPGADALGQTVRVGSTNRSTRIVGIVEQMQAMPILGRLSQLSEFVVMTPSVPPGPTALYLVRTEPGMRDEVMGRARRALSNSRPGRYIDRIEAFAETAARARAPSRGTAIILGIVTALVLAITAFGIFGLGAYSVATRTRQIGTRRALGASRLDILYQFIVENWLITTAGVVVGCASTLALGIQLSVMLHTPRLPLGFLVAGVAGIWIVSLLAVLVPARRAAAVSPAEATRSV